MIQRRRRNLVFSLMTTILLLVDLTITSRAARLPFGVSRSSRVYLYEAFGGIQTRRMKLTVNPLKTLRGGSVDMEDEKEEESEEDEPTVSSDLKQEEDENEDEQAQETKEEQPAISSEPVPITVKTNIGNNLLDHSLELTVNRSRDVAWLKETISRQLPSRPPTASFTILLNGKILTDNTLINDIMEDEDEEDEEEEESGSRLTLQLDMIPPVDSKFVPTLERKIQDMTVAELLDAYAANEALIYQNAALLMKEDATVEEPDIEDNDHGINTSSSLVSFELRERALRIRQDLEEKLLQTANARTLLAETEPPSAQTFDLQRLEVRGQRVRKVAGKGVRSHIKSQIQRNLNVNWPDTIRHFCLFLFFGYFGGRTPFSRAVLLLGAPSVFLLQYRPMKLLLRQVLYAVLDHPPGIFLSLLPAPQQAILSLDVPKAMHTLYGDYANDIVEEEMAETADDEDALIDRLIADADFADASDDDYEESDEE